MVAKNIGKAVLEMPERGGSGFLGVGSKVFFLGVMAYVFPHAALGHFQKFPLMLYRKMGDSRQPGQRRVSRPQFQQVVFCGFGFSAPHFRHLAIIPFSWT